MHTNLGREVARVVFDPHPGMTPLSKALADGLLWVTVLVWTIGAGCSGKSTGPTAVNKLPAMSLLASPIADSSATYPWSVGDRFETDYEVSFPDSAVAGLNRIDDIYLRYWCPEYCQPMDAFLFSQPTSNWVLLESEPGGGICLEWPRVSWWLLSSFDDDPAGRFLSESHSLRLHGVIWSPQARLLRYRDDYAFVVLSQAGGPGYQQVAFDGESLWMTAYTADGDSLLVCDLTGHRKRAMFVPGPRIAGIAWDGTLFWVVLSGNPPRVAQLSKDGTLTVAFTIPDDYWDNVRGGIAWMDSLLWVPHIIGSSYHDPVMEMIAMDPSESMASGVGVIVERLPAPREFRNLVGITTRDLEFVVTTSWGDSHVFRMNRDGTADEGQLLQINAGPVSWDGESLWMLHSGPAIPSMGGLRLSRFTLE